MIHRLKEDFVSIQNFRSHPIFYFLSYSISCVVVKTYNFQNVFGCNIQKVPECSSVTSYFLGTPLLSRKELDSFS